MDDKSVCGPGGPCLFCHHEHYLLCGEQYSLGYLGLWLRQIHKLVEIFMIFHFDTMLLSNPFKMQYKHG